jgi:hypothetical protein
MVGEEVVELPHDNNGLQKGAGENASLKPKGNFEPSPHLPSNLEVLNAGTCSAEPIETDGKTRHLQNALTRRDCLNPTPTN